MKNKILIMITLASVADFVAGAFLLLDDECWKLALAALLLSTFWICSFLWANSELVERTVDKLITRIAEKGVDIYARYRNKIKRVYRKDYE